LVFIGSTTDGYRWFDKMNMKQPKTYRLSIYDVIDYCSTSHKTTHVRKCQETVNVPKFL